MARVKKERGEGWVRAKPRRGVSGGWHRGEGAHPPRCRELRPSFMAALGSAPAFSSTLTVSVWPPAAAMEAGKREEGGGGLPTPHSRFPRASVSCRVILHMIHLENHNLGID